MKGWSLIFYGSKQPIDKNDPISVPLIPLTSLNVQNTNNQLAAVSKPNGGKGNRKQQQSQKPSSSSTNASSPRKNGKQNGKNQNGGGSKNWKQRLTTVRPTTILTKERKYEYINGILVVNRTPFTTTTTTRPIKLSNNNVDIKDGEKLIYVKTPIKAPKQIKEALLSSSNIYANATHNDELAAGKNIVNPTSINSDSVSSAKSISIKMTTTTTLSPYDAHVELVDSFQYTSNPNIPKLFQRYEKIQEFYPEFHPYVSLPKASSIGTATGAKPLRDSSKNSHYSSITNNNQQASSSSSSSGGVQPASTSKKSSSSRTQQSSAVISSTNGKG